MISKKIWKEYEDVQLKKVMEEVLCQITRRLKDQNIQWGVGASVLLYAYGIGDTPSDIDIVVAEGDMDKAVAVFSEMGIYTQSMPTEVYLTEQFYEFQIGEVDVDVMCGFKIQNHGIIFEYIFDELSTPEKIKIAGEEVPAGTLEDWLVLYYMMPEREKKFMRIREYLRQYGVSHPRLLERSYKKSLPPELAETIEELL